MADERRLSRAMGTALSEAYGLGWEGFRTRAKSYREVSSQQVRRVAKDMFAEGKAVVGLASPSV